MSRLQRRDVGWYSEDQEDLMASLPVLKRRHPSRFEVATWTPEMRRQIKEAGRLGAPEMTST